MSWLLQNTCTKSWDTFVATKFQAVYDDTNVIQADDSGKCQGGSHTVSWSTPLDNLIVKEKESRHIQILEVKGTNTLANPLHSELSSILQWARATSVEGNLNRNKAVSRWKGRRNSSCRNRQHSQLHGWRFTLHRHMHSFDMLSSSKVGPFSPKWGSQQWWPAYTLLLWENISFSLQ